MKTPKDYIHSVIIGLRNVIDNQNCQVGIIVDNPKTGRKKKMLAVKIGGCDRSLGAVKEDITYRTQRKL
jgi:hypothetical protein